MNTVTETPIETTSRIGKFTIEADVARNGTLILQSIPGARLRSRLRSDRPSKDWLATKNGRDVEDMLSQDQAQGLGGFPQVPGQRLEVNPSKCEYRIYDPLNDDPKMLDRVERVIRSKIVMDSKSKIRGHAEVKGKLDQHRMKTLCREVLWILENGDALLLEGPKLDMKKIEKLPGEFLLNPGSQVPNSQPKFEKDFEEWEANLGRTGG